VFGVAANEKYGTAFQLTLTAPGLGTVTVMLPP